MTNKNTKKKIFRYVLTGSPCSGKSTTLNILSDLGFFTIPGVGRIAHRYNYPKNFWDLIDLAYELENLIPKDVNIVFSSGGLPDSIAYLKAYGRKATKKHINFCRKIKYDKVFFLEMVSKYRKDEIRNQPFKLAVKIGKECESIYTNLGYNIIKIPFTSRKERVNNILSYLH